MSYPQSMSETYASTCSRKGVKGFYEECLKIELLESVDVGNGFKRRLEGICVSVREASVEDGEGAFYTSSDALLAQYLARGLVGVRVFR